MDRHPQSVETIGSSLYSSGSHTGSVSDRSGQSGTTAKSRDYTVDNSMSPIDLEVRIQTERLTAILDDAIYKSKIVVCLPHLIRDYATLSSVLTPEHMEDLLVIFEQYDTSFYSYSSMLNTPAVEDLKSGDLNLKNRLSPELSHMIYILSKYPALKDKVEDLTMELKIRYLGNLPPAKLLYLETLEEFRELMIAQMELSAADDLAKKLHLKKIIHSNQQLKKKINEYVKTMAEEKDAFDKSMDKKQVVLTQLEKELETLTKECNAKISKEVLDSERQMVLATRKHAIKSELLKEEEADTGEHYRNMLLTHLADEKQMRLRRFKAQTQLISWLQKYDLEMSDKQAELDETTRLYEEESEKVAKLEAELAEQDVEYLPLMEEREAEYEQEMANKMMTFMREHAARVIQNAWREVLANRKEKRRTKGKGRKGGSKKK